MDSFDLKHKRDLLWRDLAAAAHRAPLDIEGFGLALQQLFAIDRFWTFPGRGVLLRLSYYLQQRQCALMVQLVDNCIDHLRSNRYRRQNFEPFQTHLERLDRPALHDDSQLESAPEHELKPYFEVLIVHPFPDEYEMLYRQQLAAFKSPHDEFIYDIVFVDSAEDALTAVLANPDIQACVYLSRVLPATITSFPLYSGYSQPLLAQTPPVDAAESVELNLCRSIRCLRPELDHYLIAEQSSTELPFEIRRRFDRVLFHLDPFRDLHAAILNGVRNRYSTPFFDALQAYSRQPKSVFHALPLSRGASVKTSPWIHDMLDFYGDNIFLAETSSTQGGLDSLLDPTGAIKQAQNKAAETFGADYSYFVTNGTSTSNKIVMQATLQPGDIVMIGADCHKSVPYSAMLTGAYAIFLETYALPDYDLYGGVDLAQIKAAMLELKRQGRLDRLKAIVLTNSTFDGLIYHSERFMMEILALKPDIVFHWDEAWFAFAAFHPLYYARSAMSAVQSIRRRMHSPEYRRFYAQWAAEFAAECAADPSDDKWRRTLYPDPDRVVLRVYATQSTHKTLTSFRQASMIHVADARFDAANFLEAYRIHTSTSPNYQIIASLDIGRRQAALEGFHRVRDSMLLAVQLRQRIRASASLQAFFSVLDDEDLIPAPYRSGSLPTGGAASELASLSARWGHSDFVIDPTRVTLNIRKTGLDGSGFRQLLMTRYDIQVNKTSRHTVLLLINIGATQATIDYLLQVLHEMADLFRLERRHAPPSTDAELCIPLPEKRLFHPAFMPFAAAAHAACDLRSAFFAGGDPAKVDYLPLSTATMQHIDAGCGPVSAAFVTPYPPGFPAIVPGQIITHEILTFFQHIKVKEIHGYDIERGFKVFSPQYLQSLDAAERRELP